MKVKKRHDIFIAEYLKDTNATRAYQVAYPNVKYDTARANGAKLLQDEDIRALIDKELERIKSEKIATAEEVMEYLTSVLRGEQQSEVVVIEGIGEGCSEARTMKKKPDEKERLKAAELLGKRHGLFVDKKEVELGGAVVYMINDLEDDAKKDTNNGNSS